MEKIFLINLIRWFFQKVLYSPEILLVVIWEVSNSEVFWSMFSTVPEKKTDIWGPFYRLGEYN